MRPTITARQSDVLDAIRRSLCDRGFPPSIREIGEEVGMSSSSTVHAHLRTLERKGYLKRHKWRPRCVQLTTPPESREQYLEELLRRAVSETRNGALDWLDAADAALEVTP